VDCAGSLTSIDVDKSLQALSDEQKLLNEAEKPNCSVQSAECNYSANCAHVSADASESSEFKVNAGTAEGQSGLCSADTDVTLSRSAVDSGTAAESIHSLNSSINDSSPEEKTASDAEVVYVATNSQVDSSVSPCNDDVIVTGQKSVGSSQAELGQRSCSLTGVKAICETERRLWHVSNVRGLSRKYSIQSSIQSFFKPVSKAAQNETAVPVSKAQQNDETAVHSSNDSGQSTLSQSDDMHNSFDRNVASSYSLKTDAKKAVINESANFTDKTRKCPFYKWIPGKMSYNSCVKY